MLVPTNESKAKIKKIWRTVEWSITKNSDDFDEKHMKIKFDLYDDLPLNKTIETDNVTIVFRAIFYENNDKYYLNVFLDECLYEL